MTQDSDDEQRGDGTRRRRGTRGGRGRGARAESETDRPVTNSNEPRIVGRRPGRPRAGTTPIATPAAPPAAVALPAPPSEQPQVPAVEAAPARRAPTRRAAAPATEAIPEGLVAALADQARAIDALRTEVKALADRVASGGRRARLGVFVDVPNLLYGAERGERLDMGKLLSYLCQDRELVRATAYAPVSDNPMEPVQQQRFVAPFVPYEYRIVTKPLKRFADGSIKGNFDVEMAVDMISMIDRLEVMAIVSGDADFARVVEEAQSRGVRVEVVAFAGSTSAEMRALADRYIEVGGILPLLH